jgi:hypothetical protein
VSVTHSYVYLSMVKCGLSKIQRAEY